MKYIQIDHNRIESSLDRPIIDAIKDYKKETPKFNEVIYSITTNKELPQDYKKFK